MVKTDTGRVLLVDDDEKYLASLRRIMKGYLEVVTTKDPMQALKIFEYQGPFAVVISDYRMPFMNGIELFSRILTLNKHVQRIMLTGHAELQMAIDAVNHGKITAFLTKPIPAVSIRSVVMDAVHAYNQHLDNSSSAKTIMPASKNNTLGLYTPLTIKEKEVLSCLAKGYSNEEISFALNITTGTVKSHMNSLFNKMEVNSRSKVVARGIDLGLIKT